MDGLPTTILLHLLRLILVLCLSAQSAVADDLASSVSRVMDKARQDASQMRLPINTHQDEGVKAAQESADLYQSVEFQEKLQCAQKRIKSEVFSDSTLEPAADEKRPAPGRLAEDEKIYLFFSSSVPDETVHAYFAAVDRAREPNLIPVMKGFVPGEQGKYLRRIVKKEPGCKNQQRPKKICDTYAVPVKVQPSLFDKYAITRVPAVVYEADGGSWKITGDAGLDYLLERINRDAAHPVLDVLVRTLRGI